MRHRLICTLALAFAVAAPAGAREQPAVSWGKAGVSFDQYRQDAVECGRAGYYLDVSDTEAARVFKTATSRLESNESDLQTSGSLGDMTRIMAIVGYSAQIVEGTRPREQMKQVRKLMDDTVAACLAGRGYVRFQLTAEQRDQLRHFRRGTVQRHAFLYGLATDPSVLSAQAI